MPEGACQIAAVKPLITPRAGSSLPLDAAERRLRGRLPDIRMEIAAKACHRPRRGSQSQLRYFEPMSFFMKMLMSLKMSGIA